MLRGIEEVVADAGFNLLISSNLSKYGNTHSPALGPNNTDGIFGYADSLTESGLTHYYHIKFPVVLVYRSSPPHLPIPSVTVENKAASKEIVDHLIEVHHRRRIVFLRGPEHQEDSYWREMGYRTSLEAHNIPFDAQLVGPGEFERDVAQTTMIELILAGVEFDAVFSGDDDAAIGVLAALKEMGKRVPEDVSVVGFDDQRSSPYLNPSLTTVRAPTEEVGHVAAQQMIKLIRGGQADPLTLLPTELVIRKSCGCQTD